MDRPNFWPRSNKKTPKTLPTDRPLEDRFQGAIWGPFVGDAAALGTHWIYDLEELAEVHGEPEGFEAPAEGHYHEGKEPGEQTHYGDAARVMLASVAEQGRFDAEDFLRRFVERFSSYEGYIDLATEGTLANVEEGCSPIEAGADDDHLQTASRLSILVVAHHDDPLLIERIEEATKTTQNNPTTVAYNVAHGLLTQRLLHGESVTDALEGLLDQPEVDEEVKASIESALERTEQATVSATVELGQACPLPESFPSALVALLHHGTEPKTALLETIRAGGDNAGRAAMLGAWLGALHGLSGLPLDWLERLSAHEEIQQGVERLLVNLPRSFEPNEAL